VGGASCALAEGEGRGEGFSCMHRVCMCKRGGRLEGVAGRAAGEGESIFRPDKLGVLGSNGGIA
jgi:hypothetical protein